jgi:uncharacterized protein YcbX
VKIATVESLWRYPVKSMAGEEMEEIFAGFAGVYGDRLFAFHSSDSRPGLPYLTAREQRRMLLYRPRFRHPERTVAPPNLIEAEKLGAGATPIPGTANDLTLDVETPAGERLPIDDPRLLTMLYQGAANEQPARLIRSERALTDCRPVSLISLQSLGQLARETGGEIDKRRFRANIYLDLTTAEGFAENRFVARSLRIGRKVTLSVLVRDTRCMIITLDPDTAEKTPAILSAVARSHEGQAGVYAAILVEGMIRRGDPVELID